MRQAQYYFFRIRSGRNGSSNELTPLDRVVMLFCPLCISNKENRVRAQAGLPLFDVAVEAVRLNAAREETEFERLFEQRRPALCYQWTGNNDGWMTNMGRWAHARQLVRKELVQTSNGKTGQPAFPRLPR